ncbi:hypothetical protein [Bradyrhizobium guangdongense]|uniref:hypothetical protein n=1 Tax=Bradyrhizobium guangdongense TaxID=1325090 RepID=UPI00131A2C28|nr:hypothetical protein [Bradyrhizobium guangdongense]
MTARTPQGAANRLLPIAEMVFTRWRQLRLVCSCDSAHDLTLRPACSWTAQLTTQSPWLSRKDDAPPGRAASRAEALGGARRTVPATGQGEVVASSVGHDPFRFSAQGPVGRFNHV